MKNRIFVLIVSMLAVSLVFLVLAMIAIVFLSQNERNEKQEFRNILFILADDLGSIFIYVKILNCKFFSRIKLNTLEKDGQMLAMEKVTR
jgi:hypothetical protein